MNQRSRVDYVGSGGWRQGREGQRGRRMIGRLEEDVSVIYIQVIECIQRHTSVEPPIE